MNRNMYVLLAVSLVIAGILSWFASPFPDGLERIAIDSGFEELAEEQPLNVMPDYEVPGVHHVVATPLAGIIGTIIVFGAVFLLGKIVTKRHDHRV